MRPSPKRVSSKLLFWGQPFWRLLYLLLFESQGRRDANMDQFDDIAALACGETVPVSIEEAVEAYEKEGVKRLLKL